CGRRGRCRRPEREGLRPGADAGRGRLPGPSRPWSRRRGMTDNEGMTMARTPVRGPARQLGLRERKKIKTRMAIREATYDLIKEQGYDGTTVEQIAERAEVSPSTVFRYFPTKEDIVLTDEYDPLVE